MSKKLQPYRIEIDALDDQILDLLAKRFEIVRAVGELKTDEDIAIIQTNRAEEVMNRVETIAKEKNVPADLIRGFYADMIEEAHKIEFAIQRAEKKHA